MFQDFILALVVLIPLAAAQHQNGKVVARLLSDGSAEKEALLNFAKKGSKEKG